MKRSVSRFSSSIKIKCNMSSVTQLGLTNLNNIDKVSESTYWVNKNFHISIGVGAVMHSMKFSYLQKRSEVAISWNMGHITLSHLDITILNLHQWITNGSIVDFNLTNQAVLYFYHFTFVKHFMSKKYLSWIHNRFQSNRPSSFELHSLHIYNNFIYQ